MPTKVVVGAQWGDEGKGKLIDILAEQSDVVIRSQGGNNAGHTVVNQGEVYKLHLIPCGILYPHTLNLIGCGVVVDPRVALEEIDMLQSRGVPCGRERLRIDARAHVIMPWHLELDALLEEARGADDIGTTRRGIGPCYMDKAERTGIRIYDLTHPEELEKKARLAGSLKNNLITKVYGREPLDLDAIIALYTEYGRRLAPYVDDVSVLAYNACREGKKVLFEGAQGTLLDLDVGTYPYVTSSHPTSGGVCNGTGIGPTLIDEVIGAIKAYTTRVGQGPFPTELLDQKGEDLRRKGQEYGVTTGRARRVGWFDGVIARHAVRVNGLTGLSVNKLDTLADMGSLEVCVAYRKPDGSLLRDFPSVYEELADCEPVYESMPGFPDISGCVSFAELPESCKNYIAKLEEICGCPVVSVGVGPARDQNLLR